MGTDVLKCSEALRIILTISSIDIILKLEISILDNMSFLEGGDFHEREKESIQVLSL